MSVSLTEIYRPVQAELARVEAEAEPAEPVVMETLSPGTVVRIRSLGIEGEIESIQGDAVAVKVRGRRVRVRASDLARLR